jgi:excinuclease ABC subunit B
MEQTGGVFAEQVIRPTGLVDPVIEIRPARSQVDDLLGEVKAVAQAGYRTLVTTLTKRMAEDLTEYYTEAGIKVRYLHSDIDTLERIAILRELRMGTFDVLVGINLLREGLDLPEVALVAVLDADKEGFLRSERSLVQTMGRAARNVEGRVILYAETITGSMKAAMEETERRRAKQLAYNEAHGITPKTVMRAIREMAPAMQDKPHTDEAERALDAKEAGKRIAQLRKAMHKAAEELDFEEAAKLRDRIRGLEEADLRAPGMPKPAPKTPAQTAQAGLEAKARRKKGST